MKTAVLVCLFASVAFSIGRAEAGNNTKLPPDVHPLPMNDIIDMYSNKTINYPTFKYYFSPDHGLVGFSKDLRSFGTGTWHVEGNKICLRSVWRGRNGLGPVAYRTCYAWYSNNIAYWTQITSGHLRGNVYKGDITLVTEGDQASDMAAKAKHATRKQLQGVRFANYGHSYAQRTRYTRRTWFGNQEWGARFANYGHSYARPTRYTRRTWSRWF